VKRALLQVLVICLLSASVSARDNKFEISVALEEVNVLTAIQNIPVKVKITNKSVQNLNTANLPGILFYFSKCRQTEKCAAPKNTYVGGTDLKPKILKKDLALEFAVNLAELSWNDAHAPVLDFSQLWTMATIPEGAYYFYAEIRVFDKTAKVGEAPRYTRVLSNEIEVRLTP
jgi:hypothetical protein